METERGMSKFLSLSKCLNDIALYGYLSDSFDADQKKAVEGHLAHCDRCRGHLSELLYMLCDGMVESETDVRDMRSSDVAQRLSRINGYNETRLTSIKILSQLSLIFSQRLYLALTIVLVVILLGSILVGWRIIKEAEATGFYEQGEELLSKYHLGAASGLRLVPLFGAYDTKGATQPVEARTLDAAQDSFSRVLGVNPEHKVARLALGYIYLLKRCPEKAQQEFQEALRYDKRSLEITNSLGVALFEMAVAEKNINKKDRLLESSLAQFNRVLSADPTHQQALYNRALVYHELGKKERTLQAIDTYLKEDPASEWARRLSLVKDQLRLSSYPVFEEEILKAFEQGGERLHRLVSTSAHYSHALLTISLSKSLRAEIEGNLTESRTLYHLARRLKEVYYQQTGDISYAEIVDFYRRLTKKDKMRKYHADKLYREIVRNYETGKLNEVLRLSEKVLPVYERIADYWTLADIRSLRGNAYAIQLSDYTRAAKEYELLVDAIAHVSNPLETSFGILGVKALGRMYLELGDYDKAQYYFNQMFEAAEKSKDPFLLSHAYTSLALFYHELGDTQKAINYYARSLRLTRHRGYKYEEFQNTCYLGLLYQQRKEYTESIDCFKKGLRLVRELEASPEKFKSLGGAERSKHLLLSHQVENYLQLGDIKTANDTLKLAFGVAKDTENPEIKARNLIHSGMLFMFEGRYAEAERLLRAGISLATASKIPESEWRAHYFFGELLARQNRTGEAAEAYERALTIIESLRSRIKNTDLRVSYLAGRMDPYESLIRLQYKTLRDGAASFNTLERLKARALLDRTKGNRVLEKNSSFPLVKPETLHALRLALPDQLSVIEYFITEDETIVFFLERGAFYYTGVPIGRKKIQSLAATFLEAIQNKNQAEVRKSGFTLYKHLLQPIRDRLKPGKTLCVVADGSLFYVPFSAFLDGRGRFLLERYNFVYAPSVSSLRYCLDLGKGDVSGRRKLLAVAGDTSLPHAYEEVKSIARYYDSSTLLIHPGKDQIKAMIERCDVVHVSGHGIDPFNQPPAVKIAPDHPAGPALLSLLRSDDGRDTLITAKELLAWNLKNVRLITLSACETGIGTYWPGEGIVGLPQIFLAAGVPALVASLWKVGDPSTRALMEAFYQNLQVAGTSKAEALRRAQLKLLKGTRYHLPYHWASFEVIGDPR